MLRALLLGILASSAVVACKGKSDSPAVPAGTAAGKVVAISGSVEATRAGATRQLAMGTEVFGDDEIKTGADGTVEIELFHNHAKWSLIANKQARVDASLAWGMDKQEASKTVEHNTAAAGREAERSAAETSATASEERKKEAPAIAPPTAPRADTTPSRGAPIGGAPGGAPEPAAGEGGGGNATPPPPPPPPPPKPMEEKDEEAPKEKQSAPRQVADKGAPESMKVVISPQTLADKHKPEFAKCFEPNTQATITIDVRMNKSTTSIAGPKKITAKQRTCVADVAKTIDWPVKGSTFQVKVKLD
jgi:hypothetical protein